MGILALETVLMMRSMDFLLFLTQSASSSVAMYSSAPRARTSSFFDAFREIPMTLSAPRAFANSTPKCPRPPTPTMPTVFPGPAPLFFSGENTVTPPHSIGAASSDGRPSGMGITQCPCVRL